MSESDAFTCARSAFALSTLLPWFFSDNTVANYVYFYEYRFLLDQRWQENNGVSVTSWTDDAINAYFVEARVDDLPEADAVVVLGGGVGADTNSLVYAELFMGADRVLHAARIVKAGKAPVVIASGEGEREASLPLLKEFGVPEEAILVENESRNTEENARRVAKLLADRAERPRVLLVTSSWHMRRALLMFRRHAADVEVVPAAIDYEGIMAAESLALPWSLAPSADMLMKNSFMLKEYVGYWGYRLLR